MDGIMGRLREITHLCPPDGGGAFQCCRLIPFDVPSYHRMTLDPALVTCGRPLRRIASGPHPCWSWPVPECASLLDESATAQQGETRDE